MRRITVALSSFTNLFSVGTVYAFFILQAQIPRILNVSGPWTFAPFGVACTGLCLGAFISSSIISNFGAPRAATIGTIVWGASLALAGYFLARNTIVAFFASFIIGGIGVGITYLAVVVMVGQVFPDRKLVRSAIGPISFSTAVATYLILNMHLSFDGVDAVYFANILAVGGMTFLMVALVTLRMIPRNMRNSPVATGSNDEIQDVPGQKFLSTLLFFNALPGMTVFAALQPAISWYEQTSSRELVHFLPWSMIALASGGIFAPTLSARIGPRMTFTALFVFRGLLFLTLSELEEPQLAALALLAVLFAHGVGFSLLPGLLAARCKNTTHFSYCYGRVLIFWGLAGVGGCMCNTFSVLLSGNPSTLSLFLGLVMISCGVALLAFPQLGSPVFVN